MYSHFNIVTSLSKATLSNLEYVLVISFFKSNITENTEWLVNFISTDDMEDFVDYLVKDSFLKHKCVCSELLFLFEFLLISVFIMNNIQNWQTTQNIK